MQSATLTCSRCGAPLTPGSTECAHCGLVIDAAGVDVPAGKSGRAGRPRVKGPVGKIVTAALVGLLLGSAVIFPMIADARHKADHGQSKDNLRVIGAALLQYEQDYDGKLPPMTDAETFKVALNSYVPNLEDRRDPFIDPETQSPYKPSLKYSCQDANKLEHPSGAAVLTQPSSAFGPPLALYADGHVGTD